MKISILLPYKENFSPDIQVQFHYLLMILKISVRYKKNIIVYGNTNYKRKFKLNM